MTGPLSDIRVVEMGSLIAGPFCGQLMGDMGADVVKIEPVAGDPMREWGQGDRPSWWSVIGRNKRSVALDLKSDEGRETARALIGKADILIENFRPGTMEKLGLDPAKLRRVDPRLIVVRVSGYGQTGPYAERPGYGGVAEAVGGLRAIIGFPDRPPARAGISIGDTLAASYGCMGALAALHHRERTGEGQVVDSALYEAILQVMESTVSDYSASGHARSRSGSILPKIAPSNVYPARDGEIMIGGNGDTVFRRFAKAMDAEWMLEDEMFATHLARGENQSDLDALIAKWTGERSLADIEAILEEHGVPASRLFGPADMLADPHFAAREAIVDVDDPRLGPLKMQGVFPKLSATPGAVRRAAPATPGADTDEVLSEWLGRLV